MDRYIKTVDSLNTPNTIYDRKEQQKQNQKRYKKKTLKKKLQRKNSSSRLDDYA